jgi:PAS domain-containing protein
LANPILLRAVVVLICSGFAFLLGLIFIRLLRKNIDEESDFSTEPTHSLETLPLHVYNTVIQQLKQQKHELDAQSKAEQQRARLGEIFSQAVLSNLSSGVLVFGSNGLVKTSNPAAKEILGFASATGMNAEDIFRGAVIQKSVLREKGSADASSDGDSDSPCLADEVDAILHLGVKRRQVEAEYETPAGESRLLAVTVSPVTGADGNLLGVACVLNDVSELDRVRKERELHGELSAERALELRSSLNTISDYALQLANHRDPEMARQLASDIAEESSRLSHSIGDFLSDKSTSDGSNEQRVVPKEQFGRRVSTAATS